jgi:hypothetical protein
MSESHFRICCICKKHFKPKPRLGKQQRTCGQDQCQKQRRRDNAQKWRARNPDADDADYRRIRQRDRLEYRRNYWATHPEVREKHAAYMRRWRAARVRDPYRDTQIKFPVLNSYLQVTNVRDTNRVLEVKVLSQNELSDLLRGVKDTNRVGFSAALPLISLHENRHPDFKT